MKSYIGKTLEEAIQAAIQDLQVEAEDLNYTILEEKKGLFSKRVEIGVYLLPDVIAFTEEYLKTMMKNLGLECELKTELEDGIIKISINTDHNAILIGKNGRTLQSINEITRHAISYRFNKHYRVLLDVNSYKDEKYEKLAMMAKRIAKEVQRSKVNATLNPMTSDERRIVHNALSEFKHIRTESSGQGSKRQITIYYVE